MLDAGKIGEKDLALLHVTDDVDDAVRVVHEAYRAWEDAHCDRPSASTARPSTASPSSYVAARPPRSGAGIAARGLGRWSPAAGSTSMMGAVALAARAGGARTIGVIPQSMVDREWADHDSDELLVVDTMRERKALMEAHADAFLALPGGIGTCEELFEVWTSGYLRLHDKPVVLLDPDGHYTGLLDWVRGLGGARLRAAGGAAPGSWSPPTCDAALDACAAPVDVPRSSVIRFGERARPPRTGRW